MNCFKVSHHLSAYLDSELTGSEMLAIRSHLGICPHCRAELESLKITKRVCAVEVPSATPGFEERLSEVVRSARQNGQAQAWQRYFSTSLSVAVACVIGLGVFTSYLFIKHTPAAPIKPVSPSSVAQSQPSLSKMHLVDNPAPNSGSTGQEVQQEREYLDGADPLSGPASAIAYADR